jgi:hypothetical protein
VAAVVTVADVVAAVLATVVNKDIWHVDIRQQCMQGRCDSVNIYP